MKYYIIIPAYNEEAFMALTLQSLVAQTVLPSKIIVVNDNSTQNEYYDYDWKTNNIKIIHLEKNI